MMFGDKPEHIRFSDFLMAEAAELEIVLKRAEQTLCNSGEGVGLGELHQRIGVIKGVGQSIAHLIERAKEIRGGRDDDAE